MKLAFFLSVWIITSTISPDLDRVRKGYREAYSSEEATKKLHDQLTSVGKNDSPVLVAYKGAVTTMMAAYAEDFKDKKAFFKEGRDLLEHAVDTEQDDIEIRCIRLSVQENVPKITGYRKNKEEDKQFIIDHFDSITDGATRKFIAGFTGELSSFTEAERKSF